MTILQLAERDYKRAKINYLRGVARRGTTIEEITNLEELKVLRFKILQIVKEKTENENQGQR